MSQLKPRQRIRAELSKADCLIERWLGGGGQGDVYEVSFGAERLALKWYAAHAATPEQRSSLDTLIKKGRPSPEFLWPLELASCADVQGFGYLMPLREARFKSIPDLLKRRTEPSLRILITAGMNLAHGFLQLHAKGFSYRDISHGNVFFEPKTGEVLICDNDNVAVDGEASAGVLGTQRFMAPEIVIGKAKPSTQTDLFSLSVLLFYLLVLHHPLEGKRAADIHCMDEPAMTKLFGDDPVFIYDPKNDTNRPVPGYQDNAVQFWRIYPESLKKMFTRAFTDGIRDPINGRVRESEWRRELARLRDEIVFCPKCSVENLANPSESAVAPTCWKCNKPIPRVLTLRIGKNTIFLNASTSLFPHHIDPDRLYDFSEPVAIMSRHPKDPNKWGLTNKTKEAWVATFADGKSGTVEPGRNVALLPGVRIQFGKTEGLISAG